MQARSPNANSSGAVLAGGPPDEGPHAARRLGPCDAVAAAGARERRPRAARCEFNASRRACLRLLCLKPPRPLLLALLCPILTVCSSDSRSQPQPLICCADVIAPHAEALVSYVLNHLLCAYLSAPSGGAAAAAYGSGGGGVGYEMDAKCGALRALAAALTPENDKDEVCVRVCFQGQRSNVGCSLCVL